MIPNRFIRCGTREEQEEVLRILWNFSAEQEEKEEELYRNYDE